MHKKGKGGYIQLIRDDKRKKCMKKITTGNRKSKK